MSLPDLVYLPPGEVFLFLAVLILVYEARRLAMALWRPRHHVAEPNAAVGGGPVPWVRPALEAIARESAPLEQASARPTSLEMRIKPRRVPHHSGWGWLMLMAGIALVAAGIAASRPGRSAPSTA